MISSSSSLILYEKSVFCTVPLSISPSLSVFPQSDSEKDEERREQGSSSALEPPDDGPKRPPDGRDLSPGICCGRLQCA